MRKHGSMVLLMCMVWAWAAVWAQIPDPPPSVAKAPDRPGRVRCANLVYGRQNKTSRCFADHFLADVQAKTNIWTGRGFEKVKADSEDLFAFPFAVMSGEGAFELRDQERKNLRAYLEGGGFLVVSPGCSSEKWKTAFRKQIAGIFPTRKLEKLPPAGSAEAKSDPIYHTIYDITELKTKRKGVKAFLEVIRIDGRVVLVYSSEGLNDTANVGGDCCCCGGNEVLNARQVNANLLAYALSH